jgi:hypothetical protein
VVVAAGLDAHLLRMKDEILSRMTVRDERAALLFTQPQQRRLLLWFARRPKSVGEAAAALGMDLKRAHYFIRRLADLGLLVVAGVRARAGRPVKLYRAAADSFFIPHVAAPRGFGDDLIVELRESLARELMNGEGGMLFTANRDGAVRGRLVGSAGPSGGTEMWRVLRLRREEVAALRRDLVAVLNRYQRQTGAAGGDVYLVHAAVARRLAGSGLVDNPLETPSASG